MAEEQSPSLPPELEEWLDDRAADTGRDRRDVLARAVATYRLVSAAENATDAAPIDTRIADLERRLDELAGDTEDRIEDVRDRVVQVARSAADADHDHPELAALIEEAGTDWADDAAAIRRALAELDRQVEGGFENYEAVLSSLADRADEVDAKLDTLAGAVVDLRERVAALEAADARRKAVEDLQRDANSRNVAAGDCENCGKRVHIGLLSAPRCPHCEEPFEEVQPGGRFIGSATLITGERPALTGDAYEPEAPEEVFADDE
ncbi:hypothetical protein JCM30237_19090 [Halolamina litorea]|uniref:CopG family transcriptional regulator n=1 Tax=Halolamina litorea TaxID=1515593 RepID=A0ABD6BUA3_9EURY|nr:CopG family transcriptional regulator [Halolamina litorea]